MKLDWVREEMGGNWYRLADPPMEGWLYPALFKYLNLALKELCVRTDRQEQ